jgi:predicted AlkP superfamily pyrophosphatase or phosphodiesterase
MSVLDEHRWYGLPRATTATAEEGGPGAAANGESQLRVYVVVVDGLRPREVGPLTRRLTELKQSGTWYEQARTVFPGETLPAHAAMATGVLPGRNGIVANQFWRPNAGGTSAEYMQHPQYLESDTIVTRLERAYAARGGIATATVMSKHYLYGVFRESGAPLPQREADFHWDPREAGARYIVKPSDHAIDEATMDTFLGWVAAQRGSALPQFALVNLGDVDRAGHADESGAAFPLDPDDDSPLSAGDVSAFRQAAIENTDLQIGRLIDELKETGDWDETVLVLLSDHGMDWGPQHQFAQIEASLTNAGYRQGASPGSADYQLVGGGGSELVYVHHHSDIAPMARIVSEAPGVEFVATPESVPGMDNPTLKEMGIEHPRSPQIEAFMKPGWHSSPGAGSSNPLPGNHGHSVTQHLALFVSGGHPVLADGARSVPGERVYDPRRATDVADGRRPRLFVSPAGGPGALSVAPTVAALFGIGEPAGGYDGKPLDEAFDAGAMGQPGGAGAAGGASAGQEAGSAGAGAGPGVLGTTLAASRRRVGYRRRFALSGRVGAPPGCGGPLRVTLYRRSAARSTSARVVATSVEVGSTGAWSQTLRSPTSAAYFARVQPTRTCDGSTSHTVSVPVRARVRVAALRCGRVSGRVLPAAPRTWVRLERRRGGRYRRVVVGRLNRASRFRFRLPACTGRYRVVWPGQGGRNLSGRATFSPGRGRR